MASLVTLCDFLLTMVGIQEWQPLFGDFDRQFWIFRQNMEPEYMAKILIKN